MSIEGNINLLQAVNATVTGVGSAPSFENYPIGTLEDSGLTLPVILTFAGSGEWNHRGSEYRVSRVYDIIAYCRLRFQEDAVTGKRLAYPLLDALGKKYLDDSTYTVGRKYVLGCNPEVYVNPAPQILDRNESDEWTPVWAGEFYHGFQYSITVIEEGSI